MTKEYNLAAVLSITTGYMLVEDFGIIHELIEWLCKKPVFSHQIPSVADHCKSSIIKQFPQTNPEIDKLGDLVEWLVAAIKAKDTPIQDWIWRRLKSYYGDSFMVEGE